MWRWLLGLVLVGLLAVGGLTYWVHAVVQRPMALEEPLLFDVPRGASLARVTAQLAQADVLEQPEVVRLWARVQGEADRIHAGEYRLIPGMSARDLIEQLVAGQVYRRQFTIIEGWRFSDLREALRDAARLQQKAVDWSDASIMEVLGREGLHPEGRFFPDTYDYLAGSTDLELLRRAAERMDTVLEQEWSRRSLGLPLNTPEEALVLASIIEKETGYDGERADIAGVFTRRLQKGMRLQTDPTVIYGLGDAYESPLTRADLREATPWNTYVHHGLPPTPIALPGRASVQAALHPRESDALYFVSRGDGTSYFSATLEEHNAAVWRYLRSGRVPARTETEQ